MMYQKHLGALYFYLRQKCLEHHASLTSGVVALRGGSPVAQVAAAFGHEDPLRHEGLPEQRMSRATGRRCAAGRGSSPAAVTSPMKH